MKLKPIVALLAAAFAAPAVLASAQGVVISQVYGGGAFTSGSPPPYKYDYIEIFNGGSSAVNLTGYSLQYGSAGVLSNWSVAALNNLANPVLQPGRYLLIRQGTSTGALGADITIQDGTGNLNLSGTEGKVALVSSTLALSGVNPSGGSLVDLVGYGLNTPGFETSPHAGAEQKHGRLAQEQWLHRHRQQ